MSRRTQTLPAESGRRSDWRSRRSSPARRLHLEALEERRLLTVSANPDAYVALQSVPLSIPAPGVLSNDSTSTGTALTVTGFTQPTDGTLALNPDGSFLYTPVATYSGPDSFTYTVADGRGGSATRTVQMQVDATTDEASVFAGPRLVSVDSTQGALLNAVLGGLVGTNLNLSGADYNALANGSINGGRLADALGAELNVSPAQALTTDATLGQILDAAATVAQVDGDTAEVSALNGLAATVGPLTAPIQLGNLLQVSPTAGSLAGARLNALDLLTGSAQLFNFDNVLTTPTPIAVSGASLGLPGVVGSVAISSQVVEPPVIAIGPAGTQFHTAAVRTRLDLSLADNLDTSTLTTGLQAALPALGVAATANLGQLSVYTEVAEGSGTITAIDALAKAVTLQATPGVANVYLGSIADNLFFNRAHQIDPTTDVLPGNVGNLTLTVTNPLLNNTVLANPTVGIQLRRVALGAAPTAGTEIFTAPFPQSQTVSSSAAFLTNLANTLVANTTVSVNGTLGPLLDPLAATVVQPALSGIVTGALTPVLQPVLTNVADPALRALGVGLGQLDLTVQAVTQAAAPAANDDTASTPEGSPVAIPVLANDATLPGSTVTVTGVSSPTHGTVTINPDGTVTYSPATGFYGPDTFTYTVTDPAGATSTGTVTVGVTPALPTGRPDAYTATDGQTLVVPTTTGLLSNDTDPNGLPLQAIIGTMPTHGTLALNANGSFSYTPAAGFVGTDSFIYRASNGLNLGNPTVVTFTVTAATTGTGAGAGTATGTTTGPVVTPVPITGMAGTPTTGPVATFTDPQGGTTAGSYTATIDYGDGSAPVAGTVTGGNGAFTVDGSHTYPAAGTYPVTVTVARTGASGTGATQANIGPAASLAPSLGGTIFLDANRNGRDDPNEYGVANVPITLTGTTASGQSVTRTTTTDGSGHYTFGNLDPGTYAVRAAVPRANFNEGRALVGTAGGVAHGEAVTRITIKADTAATGYDFAALVRANCRLNTAQVRAALRVGPNGTLPVSTRGLSVDANGPLAHYFPTLAARLAERSAAKSHSVSKPKVTHAAPVGKAHAPVHLGKAKVAGPKGM